MSIRTQLRRHFGNCLLTETVGIFTTRPQYVGQISARQGKNSRFSGARGQVGVTAREHRMYGAWFSTARRPQKAGIMGFGVSFKIAPGVRIRASSRGLRTSIGPRGARIHVGAGRTTLSSGAGPLTVYTGVGGRPRKGSKSRRAAAPPVKVVRPTPQQTARANERAAQIASIASLEHALVTQHHQDFPEARQPLLPEPPPVDAAAILRAQTKEALHGVSRWSRAARRAAKEHAAVLADAEMQARQTRLAAEYAAACLAADEAWRDLCAHQTHAVMGALEAAFEDNQSPAACVDAGVENDVRYASVVVLFASTELIPEFTPSVTPSGIPTLRKRTRTNRNTLYASALGSTVLATVKEALAVAPSVDEIRLMVARKDTQAASALEYLSAIYAARFPRSIVEPLEWARLDPLDVLLRMPEAQIVRKGVAREISGLDLTVESGLAEVLEQVRSQLLAGSTFA